MAGRIAYYGNIVKDGLVFDLDAAKRDSYPGNGTVWRDVSGFQNNGTLTNGPTFDSNNGGSIIFDGVDDYVSGTTFPLSGSAFTIGVWIRPLVIPATKTYFSIGSAEGTDLTIHFRLLSNTILRFGMYSDDLDVTIPSVTGNWNYLVGRLTSTRTQSIYRNGNFVSSRTSSGLFRGNTNFSVGAWGITPTTQFINADIPQVQVYNRALSDVEILQNYNALKGRYGL